MLGGGTGGLFYGRLNSYNPQALYPVGSTYCPKYLANEYLKSPFFGSTGYLPCGLNNQLTRSHSDTYGIQPKVTLTVPEYFGIANTVKFGALIAKETSPTGTQYLGGAPTPVEDAAHEFGTPTGGTEREIYQAYLQDKIDFLDNTLHVTPGATLEGTHSSLVGGDVFGSKLSPAYGPNGVFNGGTNVDQYGYYKATKWDREWLPFVNATYDFDRLLPPLKGLSAYGSFGDSALFAPVGDFGPNTVGPPPYASIVHMYEGGVVYNTSSLLLRANYFYQKIDRDFGFFNYQSGPQAGQTFYNNNGQRESKGVEASAVYQLTPRLQLFGNVSHQLVKYLTTGLAFVTVAEDQYGVAIKGSPVSGIPDWLSTFGADYSGKSGLVDGDSFEARLTGQYTGHQSTTYDLQGASVYGVQGVPGVNYSSRYNVYQTFTGATVYDPNGGISPYVVFGVDLNYRLPTPQLGLVKSVTFDLNLQNLLDQRYFQYFYRQVSPSACGTFTSGPYKGLPKNNYDCTPEFSDAIPGQPVSAFFTVTARF